MTTPEYIPDTEIKPHDIFGQVPVLGAIAKYLSRGDLFNLHLAAKVLHETLEEDLFTKLTMTKDWGDRMKIVSRVKDDNVMKEALEFLVKKFGKTPHDLLIEACELGYLKIVKILLHKDFKLEKNDILLATMNASSYGHLDIVKYLVEEFGLTKEDIQGNDVLIDACRSGNLDLVKYLVEEFALTEEDVRDNDNEALIAACNSGHLKIVKYLHKKFGLTAEDARASYNQALTTACGSGCLKIVKYLHTGFGLTTEDARDNYNDALRSACEGGHLDVVKYLHKGFGLTAKDALVANPHGDVDYRYNSLEIACEEGHLDIVEYLREGFGVKMGCDDLWY